MRPPSIDRIAVFPATVHPAKATIAVVSALSATRRKKSKVSVLDKSRR
jgi:hypothetical protein